MRTTTTRRPEDLILAMPESAYRVMQPIPELGAVPGDYIIVRPGDPEAPCTLERMLPFDQALRHVGDVDAPLVYATPPREDALEASLDRAPQLRLVRPGSKNRRGTKP